MSNGGCLHGKSLLSPETHAQATALLAPEYDRVLHEVIQLTQGGFGCFQLPGIEQYPFLGWGGAGGSVMLWNEQLQIGFSYVMNAMGLSLSADRRSIGLLKAVVDTVVAKQVHLVADAKEEEG